VHALNDVTAVVEHTANVLGVHSASEVGVAVVAPISTSSMDSTHQKFVADEVLGPGHAWVLSGLGSSCEEEKSSVASKFWKVVLNLRFSSKDFLSEQVLLVEEQNHRDGAQPSNKEGDALEEVQSLLQAVGLVVLPNDHVVAAAGHHEDDGSHIFTLDPFAAFIALATHVKHAAEDKRTPVDFVHLELGLKDSRSQDTAAKTSAYLITGHVVSLLDDINLVQERGYSLLGAVNQLVLVGALIAGTHSFILPQSLGMREVKVRHVHHAQNVVHSELVLRVGQLHGGHQVAHGGHDDTYFDRLFQVVFDVLNFGCLLTTVGLKRERDHIASH
uniref:GNAS complex locus n=3 Tax=Canis lupus TaxID=9612 RepID=A0A8C0Z2B8_CANLF